MSKAHMHTNSNNYISPCVLLNLKFLLKSIQSKLKKQQCCRASLFHKIEKERIKQLNFTIHVSNYLQTMNSLIQNISTINV